MVNMTSRQQKAAIAYGARLGLGKGAFFGGLLMMMISPVAVTTFGFVILMGMGILHTVMGAALWSQTNGMRWRITVKHCPHDPVHLSQHVQTCYDQRIREQM